MKDTLPGITTWAEPENGVYLRENNTVIQTRIGIFEPSITEGCNRMRPDRAGFEALGIPALKRCLESDSPCVQIDEIGYLETACPEYCDLLLALFEQKQVFACVRKQELPFLKGLLSREDAFVIDLDKPFGNSGCIIMASGLGKRFGGNKLMAGFKGAPLISGALEASGHIPNRVVVTRHPDVTQYCRSQGIPALLHELPHRSDTVRLGMERMADTDCCIFCQGDQPLLRSETVDSLILLGIQENAPIVQAASNGVPGSPILFPSRFYNELLTLPEGKGGSFVAKKHPEQVQLVPVRDAYELLDVDTPEDLRFLAGQ